jgi:UDP-N-acetylglucosamine:LPS N-acetylglucosamine transferase
MKKLKICLACSAGGHLTEALDIGEALEKKKDTDIFYVTFPSPHLKATLEGRKYYTITDPRRSPVRFFASLYQALKVLRRERPDVVISTGAGVTVPVCYLGKTFGAKVVYVECGCRVTTPSLAGRIIYPIADLFIVRWRPLLKYFKKAKLGETL